jgi:hypothetical protein
VFARLLGKVFYFVENAGSRKEAEVALVARIRDTTTGRVDLVGMTTREDASYVSHLQQLFEEAYDTKVTVDSLCGSVADRRRMRGNKWDFPPKRRVEKEEEEEADGEKDATFADVVAWRDQMRADFVASTRKTRLLADAEIPRTGYPERPWTHMHSKSFEIPTGDMSAWKHAMNYVYVEGVRKRYFERIWRRRIKY